ncbi:VWA domain-containing protein [Clostridium botulinum]|uniref:vWA domain-containing protein n=1 Tax=Clostridium botulinum TaxID=1491 RepID=UPI002247D8F1|nr:VWA domain-containing protein [Clostridium botulinum]UZP03176.1 VWA domain-containing protein [Clostridium botulinum]UZP06534.1 VWA domain-containing protein [Clostridium botulinum]UZP09915.1 VWA domain-containing protein [Clostridium botulinum]
MGFKKRDKGIFKNIKLVKHKKDFIRTISIFLSTIFVATLINESLVNAQLKNSSDNKCPSFDVKITSIIPEEAYVDENITVEGEIIPKSFNIDKKNNIVLVIDISESMDAEITKQCDNDRKDRWGKCIYHNVSGKHKSTKMGEAKRAADNFIDKVSELKNPSVGVCIVAYASRAVNNPGNDNYNYGSDYVGEEFFKPCYKGHTERLHQIIRGLEADGTVELPPKEKYYSIGGGTNIGEGLRKAEFMLQREEDKLGGESVESNIVFMTDGVPNNYSNKNDIDIQQPQIIKGHNDNSGIFNTIKELCKLGNWPLAAIFLKQEKSYIETSTEYAKNIARTIHKKNRNIYSIAYGQSLNKSFLDIILEVIGDVRDWLLGFFVDIENKKPMDILKEIHEDMGGNEKNFLEADDDGLENAFNNIAGEITKNYNLNDINIKLNLNDNITLINSKDKIDIDNIVYKQDSKDNNKKTYVADPVKFKFTIKAKNQYKGNIFDEGSTINFIWNVKQSQEIFLDKQITILNRELPKIDINLKSKDTEYVELNDQFKVDYNILPKSFNINNLNHRLNEKDIVFLFDTSKFNNDTKEKENELNLKGGIFNELLYNKVLAYNKVKYGLTTYNEDSNKETEVNIPLTNDIDKFKERIEELNCPDINEKNIVKTLNNAEYMLENGDEYSEKYIIIISNGYLTYDYYDEDKKSEDKIKEVERKVQEIKNKGYNIITLQLGKQSNENEYRFSTLKNLHSQLGGQSEDYFITEVNGDKELKSDVIKEITQKLNYGLEDSYLIDDFKFKFKLSSGINFTDTYIFNEIDGIKEMFLPKIEYRLEEDGFYRPYYEDEKGIQVSKYKPCFIKEGEQYRDIGFPMSFNMTANKNIDLNFNIENEYTNIDKIKIKKNVKTPLIKIQQQLRHGVYNGINDGIPNIREAEKGYPKATRVNFGAYFKYNGQKNIQLNIDANERIYIDGPVNLYKINNNDLELIDSINETGKNKKYIFELDNSKITNEDKILVLYNEILPNEYYENNTYINTVKLNEKNYTATISVKNEEVPELY